MRHKVIISAISAIAIAAIVGALVVKHRFPFEAAGAAQPPAVPTVPVVAGTVTSGDVPIYLQGGYSNGGGTEHVGRAAASIVW